MEDTPCRVGVVGAGVVGGGVIELLLTRNEKLRRRGGVTVELTRVADLDRAKALATGLPPALWVDDYRKIVDDPQIDIVVELIGGTGAAEKVVRAALEAGKHVVTANKALLAEKGRPLFALAAEKGLTLAFEAAVCGGIPIILSLREGLVANRIDSLLGIVNGTCNYVLCEMVQKSVSYADAVAGAQKLGYAETPPDLDVKGIDSGHKLALLSALAFETWVDFPRLHIEGISGIELMDLAFADYLGYTIKLLAVARPEAGTKRIFLSVHPALLRKGHPLATVSGSMNAVSLHGDVVLESMFYGRGAGRGPTASAVTSDIVAVARQLRGQSTAPGWRPEPEPHYELAPMADYRARYYLRLLVQDCPGVMGKLTSALGDHGVSIASVHQFENECSTGGVPISVITHASREGSVATALEAIGNIPALLGKPVMLRIEE